MAARSQTRRKTDIAPAQRAASRAESEGNLSERVYRQLSGMILEKKLPGGTAIVEGRLAEELDVSRTPMREALGRLAGEGLLVRTTPRSYSVRRVSPSEFFQSMRVREILEAEALDMAIDRVPEDVLLDLAARIKDLAGAEEQESAHWQTDDRLHMLFAEYSGNAVLARLLGEVRVTTRLFELSRPFDRVQHDGAEHLAIIEACLRRDRAAANEALLTHLRNLQREAIDAMTGGAVGVRGM